MPTLQQLHGREILDSRGRPTVAATCELASGARGSASVPSGASTGSAEALEVRDGDPSRYRGLGCRRAAQHISQDINAALAGKTFNTQQEFDDALCALDGTPNKSRLGANALLAVSLAFARAHAQEQRVPLYEHFSHMLARPLTNLPRPTINLFSGGKHAGGQVPLQDVLLVPLAAPTMDDALAHTYAVYQSAAELIAREYQMRALTADEGGLAPPFPDAEAMLSDAIEAISAAGLIPGRDMALALDVASTHFYHDGTYELGGARLNSAGMMKQMEEWLARYPLVSIEDGLAEDDWDAWVQWRARAAGRTLVLGDDLLCTNPSRIQRAIDLRAADALLLKVNQIGTLTEAAHAYTLARGAGWKITVSGRSGETEDDWLSDLAVGWGGDYIKIGSITHSERLAKYNRLLAIEAETDLHII